MLRASQQPAARAAACSRAPLSVRAPWHRIGLSSASGSVRSVSSSTASVPIAAWIEQRTAAERPGPPTAHDDSDEDDSRCDHPAASSSARQGSEAVAAAAALYLLCFGGSHADAAMMSSPGGGSWTAFLNMLALFLPALGWAGFNILQPLLVQLNKMSEARSSCNNSSCPQGPSSSSRRDPTNGGSSQMPGSSLSAAIAAMAAPLLVLATSPEAAHANELSNELATVAMDDRVGSVGMLVVPALVWVGIIILQPLLTQLDKMADARRDK